MEALKTTLVPIKSKDPFLSGYEVVDLTTGMVLGTAVQYWHETIRSTTRSASYTKSKRWMAIQEPADPKNVKVRGYMRSRGAAVEYILGGVRS